MTCPSCENRIEKALKKLPGIRTVKASFASGRVEIEYDPEAVTEAAVRETVEKAGYKAADTAENGAFTGIGIGIVIVAAYLLIDALGGFTLLPSIDSSFGYGMLFLAGILTSFHCIAMCGGIALSQSLPAPAGGPGTAAADPGFTAKLRPGLLYNGGRVLSYTLIGGAAGALGGAFGFSPGAKVIITGLAGLFMLFLGLRMLGLLRRVSMPSVPLPRFLRSAYDKLSGRGPFVVGILNGFMPCGPLQTMQLYALGTGSALAGALSMFLFSLGTVPLLLGFGAAASIIPKRHSFHLVRAGAVLVLFLGIATIGRALTLSGYSLPEIPDLLAAGRTAPSRESSAGGRSGSGQPLRGGAPEQRLLKAAVSGGVQRVVTEIGPSRYVPFTVQAGIPVEWTVRVKAQDLNGCNNPMVVPAYGLKIRLKPGDNLVRFTPDKEGTVPYSCWMGMIRSRIVVVSDLAGDKSAIVPDTQGPGTEGSGGSCCSGSSSPEFAEGRVPVETIGMPIVRNGIQEMTITVTEDGYYPAAVVLQKGMKAKFVFKPESLNSCNSPVDFPEYRGRLDLGKGELETPPLEVSADFTFRCRMGMLNGYVKVVDDISRMDVDAVRKEIENYRAPGAGASCCSPKTSPETAGR
jgi:sulfite exporter TauE/SafE/plastocyanin domain-containing protein/copper chaperone CopZ